MKDDGEAAIARERAEHAADEAFKGLQRELAFKRKMQEMRAEKSIPSYTGPRAAK